jgi:hypothetical protein
VTATATLTATSTATDTATTTSTVVPPTETPTQTVTNTPVPPTGTPTSSATFQSGQEGTETPAATATTDVPSSPTATATTDKTGGENETPVDPTVTPGISDLPETGSTPGSPGRQGLLASLVVAFVLVGIGFHLRRQAMR